MAIQGRIPVDFGAVFPHGVYATGPAAPQNNFDTKQQERDKVTNQPVWVVDVFDADPEAGAKQAAIRVKVLAEVCPVVPEPVFGPFRPVEFTGLTVTPYVEETGRGRDGNIRTRVAYSFRASGLRAPNGAGKPAPAPRPASAKDAA